MTFLPSYLLHMVSPLIGFEVAGVVVRFWLERFEGM